MSIVEASSVGVKTMADGTLRLTVDIEPMNAQAGFTLFGSPGTPVALAALKTGQGVTQPAETPPEPATPAVGPICRWLGMRCKEAPFQEWVGEQSGLGAAIGEQRVAEWVRGVCGIKSRTEIDGNAAAERLFESRIRKPWLLAQREQVPKAMGRQHERIA